MGYLGVSKCQSCSGVGQRTCGAGGRAGVMDGQAAAECGAVQHQHAQPHQLCATPALLSQNTGQFTCYSLSSSPFQTITAFNVF